MFDDQKQKPQADPHYPLLFEMIRSFTTLAATLNLSHAVSELKSTRQTVRRHIALLEEAFGEDLFTIRDRRYELTEAGINALPEAQEIQARGSAWIKGQLSSVRQMQSLQAAEGEWEYYQQQHPLGTLFSSGPLLLREGLRAWTIAGGRIEHEALQHIRPYLIVYRETGIGWVCVEFGAHSWFSQWYGPDIVRSSIGKPLTGMPGGDDFGRLVDQAFKDVVVTESARLDHLVTKFPLPNSHELHPAAYQRLMMAGYFPDASLALLTLVMPTNDVQLRGFPPEKLVNMPIRVPVHFDSSQAMFES